MSTIDITKVSTIYAWNSTTLAVGYGGTGQTTYTDGQLLIGSTTGNTLVKATLTGTSNQITVTNAGGSITLATPQNIHTAATPSFAGLTLTGAETITGARLLQAKGASVASANNLSLGTDGNMFHITGATQINLLDSTSWQAGAVVRLIFDSTPVVKHNQTASGSNKSILLSGAVDFTTAANNTLTLGYDGTSWYEFARKT